MFGTSLECGIKAVKVRVQDVQGRVVRRCRVTLSHEFDQKIARELGKDAVALRAGLRSLSIDKAVLPIEGIAAMGAFTAQGESIKIGRMTGVKATGDRSEGRRRHRAHDPARVRVCLARGRVGVSRASLQRGCGSRVDEEAARVGGS